MENLRTVAITNGNGETIEVELEFEGDREGGSITIEGINYHFERLKKERLLSDYKIDDDPDYEPQADADGYCYLIAPFSA
jgi:hypothetical protein